MVIQDIFGDQRVTPALHLLTIDDHLRELGLPLARAARRERAVAREQWAEALAIYRDATAAFRRAVEIWRRVHALRSAGRQADDRAGATPGGLQSRALVRTTPHLPLTPRERDVAEQIVQGLSNRLIAQVLVIEPGTVANHVAHILTKCGVSNRTQLAALLLSAAESPYICQVTMSARLP